MSATTATGMVDPLMHRRNHFSGAGWRWRDVKMARLPVIVY